MFTFVPLASAGATNERNIVQTAVAAGQFKTLVTLVKQAGLAGTLEGNSLSIRVKSGKVLVGGATVTKADVMASNGVIHVINRVLIP